MATVQSGKWKTYESVDVELIQGLLYAPTQGGGQQGLFRIALALGSSNANDLSAVKTFADLTDEVADGNGYSAGGPRLVATRSANPTPPGSWLFRAPADFDASNPFLTASGGDITFRYLVLYLQGTWNSPVSSQSAVDPVMAVALADASNADVTVPDGTPLQIAFDPDNVFPDLTGGILAGLGTGDVDS